MQGRTDAGQDRCRAGQMQDRLDTSVAELEPEPELIFFWVGAEAAFFKAAQAPAASFRQAKKKSLVLVSNMTLKAV